MPDGDGVNDGYGTTTAEMEVAGRKVQSVNDGVRSQLAMLRSNLEPLRGFWTGGAALQFTALMQRWDDNARSLNDALGSIGESILASAGTYQRQEDEQSTRMSSINVALDN